MKEFDLTITSNKKTLTCYFCKELYSFIPSLLNNWKYDLDLWEEVVKTIVDTKIKASLQLPSRTREIDSKCSKSYKPSAKKNKDKSNQKHWDGDKTKPHNPSLANTSHSWTTITFNTLWI